MSKLLLKDILYGEGSNVKVTSMIRQQIFLKEVASTVAKSENTVKKILENIRDLIAKPENVTVHIATDLKKLQGAHKEQMVNGQFPQEWIKLLNFEGKEPVRRLANGPDIKWMKDHETLKSTPQQYILGLSSALGGVIILGSRDPRENGLQ